jgi:hypothetical protein
MIGAVAVVIGAVAVIIAYGRRLPEPKRSRVIYFCLALMILAAQFSYFQFFYIPNRTSPLLEKIQNLEEEAKIRYQRPRPPATLDGERGMIDSLRNEIKNNEVRLAALRNELADSTNKLLSMYNKANVLQKDNRELKKQIESANALPAIEASNVAYTVSIITSEQNQSLRETIEQRLYCWGFKIDQPVPMTVEDDRLLYHSSNDERKAKAIADAVRKEFRINLAVKLTEDQRLSKQFRIHLQSRN